MARIRTFIAVDIAEDTRDAAEQLQQQLATAGIAAKWVTPADFHLTLHFLGDINEREVGGLCKAVSDVARKHAAFSMAVQGIGAFPNLRRPKTLWVGLSEGVDELREIHAALREPLEMLGVYRHEDRRYTPHLTLGRVKAEEESDLAATELAKFQNWSGGRTMVHELRVYRSEPGKNGQEYTLLGRGELRGKPKKKKSDDE